MKKISVCLWFDNQAEEASQLYLSLFENSKVRSASRYGKSGSQMSGQKEGTLMMMDLQLGDLNVLLLNGGPMFKFTPSMSFTVHCKSEAEIDAKWKALSAGGTVRMGLDKYPWSQKYGWTTDKFGVEWQLNLNPAAETQIQPSILFVDSLFGKGHDAIRLYTSVFPGSKIDVEVPDPATKTVMYSEMTLLGQKVSLMEGQGKHGHTPTPATSLMVSCDTQEEIDRYWAGLTADGGTEQNCGWLCDKYGVSWQIVPSMMSQIMSNAVKGENVMAAMRGMKKLDIAKLQAAAK